ncbi:MAG: Ig-like domain-containing protein, partial [Thermoplasmata archaeon]|nr:Ig-like domain-containing protein [Thermoplasmata archaeon]
FIIEDANSVKVPGEISYNTMDNIAIFDPTANLTENMTYGVTLTPNIRDLSGNGLDSDGDGVFEPEEEYSWTFITAIYPPVMLKIPTQRPVEGEDWDLDMTLYVSDSNTPFEDLIITENSSYAEVSEEFIIFNYLNSIATEIVNVTVSDGISTVWQDVLVEVKHTNDPPVISPIPDIHALEDIDKVVDISTYVSDIDNELEELMVYVNTTYAKVSGMIITFNYPNGVLGEMVNITVDDGITIAYIHVKIIITPVNDAPYIAEIPDQQAVEDIELVLNITKYIFDIDNTIDELEVSANSNYAAVEKVGNESNIEFYLIINYPNGILSEKFYVTVSDGDKSGSTGITVNITPVNDPPMLDVIPEQFAIEDVDFVMDLSKFVKDIDTPPENFILSINSEYLIMIEPGRLSLTFNYPDGITEEIVNIGIEDGIYKYNIEFKINIKPVNDQPRLYNAKVSPAGGDIGTSFVFTVTYWDIEGVDKPTVELVIDENVYEMKAESLIDNVSNEVKYTYTMKLSKGNHYYYFRCDDNSGQLNSSFATENAVIKVTRSSDLISNLIVIGIISNIVLLIILIVTFLLINRHRVDRSRSPLFAKKVKYKKVRAQLSKELKKKDRIQK